MGANESTKVQMTFDHPNSFYSSGEQIEGNVSYQNTHERLVLDEICLEFIGELGYTTHEKHHSNETSGNSPTEPYTIYHRIPFVNVRRSVAQPSAGQRQVILDRGQNSWPFNFILSVHLPPSVVPLRCSHPYVKYYVKLTVHRPWYKSNIKRIYPLTIFPRVTLLHIYESQEPVPFSNLNRKKVQLEGRLLRGGIVPKQKLSIQVKLQNPNHCVIKRIEAVLIRHLQIGQSHHEEGILWTNLPGLSEFNGTELRRTFGLRIGSNLLAPTCKFMTQHNHQIYPVIIKYELALKVKSNGMLTSFEIKVPVIIGTELAPDPTEQDELDNLTDAFMGRATIADFEEAPPSYETVLSNLNVNS